MKEGCVAMTLSAGVFRGVRAEVERTGCWVWAGASKLNYTMGAQGKGIESQEKELREKSWVKGTGQREWE